VRWPIFRAPGADDWIVDGVAPTCVAACSILLRPDVAPISSNSSSPAWRSRRARPSFVCAACTGAEVANDLISGTRRSRAPRQIVSVDERLPWSWDRRESHARRTRGRRVDQRARRVGRHDHSAGAARHVLEELEARRALIDSVERQATLREEYRARW